MILETCRAAARGALSCYALACRVCGCVQVRQRVEGVSHTCPTLSQAVLTSVACVFDVCKCVECVCVCPCDQRHNGGAWCGGEGVPLKVTLTE